MGLDVAVGMLADLGQNDPEGLQSLEVHFESVNEVLAAAGLPRHVEPVDCEPWGRQMYGYSGLHYLRRLAAYLDAGLPLPSPGDRSCADDPVLMAYYDNVTGKRPSLLKRLFHSPPRFARGFDHLILHSDSEGFYLPQDFPQVLVADDESLPGGMLGSAPRLLTELDRLASLLGLPDHLDADSDALWDAAEGQGEGDEGWQRYGIESFSCVVLREACRKSVASGAAIVFC